MILGGTLLSRLELNLLMNRFILFLSCSLLCCVAAAQNPTSDPAASAVPPTNSPGVMETVSPEILQFQKIEDSWSDAVNRRDQYGLELVLSPLFVDVSASGDVTTRNQQVAQVLSLEDKTLYLTQKVVGCTAAGCASTRSGPCCGRMQARRRESRHRKHRFTCRTRSPGAIRGHNSAEGTEAARNESFFIRAAR
jgi:hypothetical protein